MIPKSICDRVITIGPEFHPPKGGIAQVLHNYENYVFENLRFIPNSANGLFKNLLLLIWSIIQLSCILIVSRNKQIVHIHTASGRSFQRSSIYVFITKILGHYPVMHIHAGGFKIYYDKGHRNFVSNVLKKCKSIIVLTNEWKNIFEQDLNLANIISINNLIPQPILQKSSFQDGKIHLVFFGDIIQRKGVFDIIEVIRSMNEVERSGIVFHVCGNGEVEKLSSLIKEYDLDDIVVYEGWVSGDKKQELLNKCDIMVQPSYLEALSLSVLEGMAYGLPIIATNVGGIPSIVKDGQNGYLCNPGDIEEMKMRLEILLQNDDVRKKMGQSSQKIVLAYFPDQVSHDLEVFYKSILSDKV